MNHARVQAPYTRIHSMTSKIVLGLVFMLLMSGCTPGIFSAFDGVSDVLSILRVAWNAVGVGITLVGLILLFSAYKNYYRMIGLVGFLFGAIIGFAAVVLVTGEPLLGIAGGGIGGMIGGFAGLLSHGVGIFAISAVLSFAVAQGALGTATGTEETGGISIFIGFIGGIVLSSNYNYIVAIIGAFIGAWLLSFRFEFGMNGVIALGILGFVVQAILANARSEDVLRRKNFQPREKQDNRDKQASDVPRPKRRSRRGSQYKSLDEFSLDDFDPNAEIQVYEDRR